MPTPGGRRHWPRHSGYFESSTAKATALAAQSAAASATVVAERRNSMRNLHTFLCGPSAREIAQVRRRLARPGRREVAVRPDHIHLVADRDMLAVIGADGFTVIQNGRAVAPIGLGHRPGARERLVSHGDLVDQDVRIGLVEKDALADDRVVVLMQRQARAVEIAWPLEVAGLGDERIEAAVAVGVLPLPDGEPAEARIDLARPRAPVSM